MINIFCIIFIENFHLYNCNYQHFYLLSQSFKKYQKKHFLEFYASSGGSAVANLPANEADVGSIPGLEDPLGKEMTTHSSILAWEIPLQKNMVGYSPWDYKRVGHDLVTKQQQQQLMIQKSENYLGDKKYINL